MPWGVFLERIPQPCTGCGAPCQLQVSGLDAFRNVSAATCPAAALHVNVCFTLRWLHLINLFDSLNMLIKVDRCTLELQMEQ